jgi:hypothetical protein
VVAAEGALHRASSSQAVTVNPRSPMKPVTMEMKPGLGHEVLHVLLAVRADALALVLVLAGDPGQRDDARAACGLPEAARMA